MSTNAERSRSEGSTRPVDGTWWVALLATAVAAALGVLTAYARLAA